MPTLESACNVTLSEVFNVPLLCPPFSGPPFSLSSLALLSLLLFSPSLALARPVSLLASLSPHLLPSSLPSSLLSSLSVSLSVSLPPSFPASSCSDAAYSIQAGVRSVLISHNAVLICLLDLVFPPILFRIFPSRDLYSKCSRQVQRG